LDAFAPKSTCQHLCREGAVLCGCSYTSFRHGWWHFAEDNVDALKDAKDAAEQYQIKEATYYSKKIDINKYNRLKCEENREKVDSQLSELRKKEAHEEIKVSKYRESLQELQARSTHGVCMTQRPQGHFAHQAPLYSSRLLLHAAFDAWQLYRPKKKQRRVR
jgi:hypothetical protein